jgi:hypothetical protein
MNPDPFFFTNLSLPFILRLSICVYLASSSFAELSLGVLHISQGVPVNGRAERCKAILDRQP